jgi:hypothetical protein
VTEVQRALQIFPLETGDKWLPAEDILEDFERSGKDYIPFLDPEALREHALWADLPPEWDGPIQRGAGIVRQNPALGLSFSLVSELLIREGERYGSQSLRYWPDPENEMGEEAPLFFLLVALNCVPVVRTLHRDMGVPEAVTKDTCSAIGRKARDYYFHFDRPGVMKWAMYWFQHYMQGRLFRVGRLEYMIKKVHDRISLYRDYESGRTRLIMNSPADGKRITVFPEGAFEEGVPEEILRDWTPLLTEEDLVLDVHIPGGGDLSLDSVRDSFSRAVEFFDAFFPEKRTKGFECVSWIFSRDLEALFEPGANLICLRNQTYLFPVQSEIGNIIPFLCGTFSENPEEWPEKTSVQRRLKAHLKKGGEFRMSGMIYLREDLDRLGEFPYRT